MYQLKLCHHFDFSYNSLPMSVSKNIQLGHRCSLLLLAQLKFKAVLHALFIEISMECCVRTGLGRGGVEEKSLFKLQMA